MRTVLLFICLIVIGEIATKLDAILDILRQILEAVK